jgi:uncharacterized membrane protein
MREKLKNYGLWVSVSALGLLIVQDAGLLITPDKYAIYSNSILGIFVLLGIISDPASGKFFADKEKDNKAE